MKALEEKEIIDSLENFKIEQVLVSETGKRLIFSYTVGDIVPSYILKVKDSETKLIHLSDAITAYLAINI